MSHLEFFATAADIRSVLERVEEGSRPGGVSYCLVGMADNSDVTRYCSYDELVGLGTAINGDPNHEPAYLITTSKQRVVRRKIKLRDGSLRYSLDQELNPDSIVLRPCGRLRHDCIIAGSLSTASESEAAGRLFQHFRRKFRQRFTAVRGYLVGAEARAVLDAGGRLTANDRSPREYDLTLPAAE